MSETRTFHIGDILSVTSERLVSPRRIDGVYDILNWMTGDNLFTHQLMRANDECAPFLRDQFPDLAGAEVPVTFDGEEHVWRWLDEQVRQFGESREVRPLPMGDHAQIDPLTEMRMVAPHAEVIAVTVPDPHASHDTCPSCGRCRDCGGQHHVTCPHR